MATAAAAADKDPLNVTEQADGTVLVDDPNDPSHSGDQQHGDDHDDDDDHDGDAGQGGDGRAEGGAVDARTTTQEAVEDATLTDPEREAIRARRREERRTKKDAARQRELDMQRELASRDRVIDEMRQRLLTVENRNVAADVAQLDTSIAEAARAVDYYKGIIEEGTKKQDGRTVAEATQRMLQATTENERLRRIKEAIGNGTQNQGSGQIALDQTVLDHAADWRRRYTWYDPSGRDVDSSIVLTLDRKVLEEGFDPRTKAYWDELAKRVDRYLPHKKDSSYTPPANTPQQGKPARTPVAGSGREGGAGNGSRNGTTYQLSAARVQALKDAGTWDDVKLRNDAIRRFRDYDRQHATDTRS